MSALPKTLPKDLTELDEIDQYWYFDDLCKNLAVYRIPEKPLSPVERQMLTEFLLGYTPNEIAQKFNRADSRSISTSRSSYLYPLIKALIREVTGETIQPDSPRTLILLEKMGYRKALMASSKTSDVSPRLSQFATDQFERDRSRQDIAPSKTPTPISNSRV
jgi:hypothetical protein